ncbi:hypothetical protein Q8A67_000262 [Cirrhinus molitorella]|uniref:Uncharacterized protein n=1 Tax=Cirrhinus molitorella TaxID=172907 RepID=A0AA88QF53_9TELE|nr:hypothetical protein Q8A67_000262 [Cirrhinus molitorella]
MAANPKVDEARSGENNATPVEEARLLANGKENTTQSQLVMPSGVPSSSVPDKTEALKNLVTKALVPLTNKGVAVTPGDSTTQSPEPKSDGNNTSTLRCGEKRERESDKPSGVPVKRRLRSLEDCEEECLPDYDERCAELWIDGEMAALEAYELSKSSRNTPARQLNAVRPNSNNNPGSRPATQKDVVHIARAEVAASFQTFTKLIRLSMEWRRADFNEVINGLRGLHRDVTGVASELRSMRAEQTQMLDAISLMNERMSVIQRCVLDMHQLMDTKK